jgi:lysophospholipase L1-like esterase
VKDFDPDLVIVWHGINDLYRSCSPPRFSRGVYQADYSHFWGPTAEMVMKHEQLPDPPPLFSFGESLLARRLSSFTNALYQDFRKDDPIRLVDVDEFASLAAFERNMRGIIHAVRGDGKRVVFATQPYLYREGLSPEELSNVKFGKFMCVTSDGEAPNLASMALGMKNFNDATRKIAKEAGVPLIELAAALPKTGEYFLDDVHYTEKANAVVARSIHDFLANSRLLE